VLETLLLRTLGLCCYDNLTTCLTFSKKKAKSSFLMINDITLRTSLVNLYF